MAKQRKREEQDDNFYEAIGATSGFAPWDTTTDEAEEPAVQLPDRHELTIEDTKSTAIITLILTAVVAIGLVLLFVRGLELIKGATPQPPTTNLTL
jgi:hypothetical protein